MKKLIFLLSVLLVAKFAYSQACEPEYNDWITIDDTQDNLTVWQCYARGWSPSFANCPHDFTDCIAYRYNGSFNVENGQSDGQQINWAVQDENVKFIQMNRRKFVAFQGYVFDYLKVYINRWIPASQYGLSNPRQFCVPLSPINNTINLLDACYWQTQVSLTDDPSGMHFQPIQTLPNSSLFGGRYGKVVNFSFYYLDGSSNEVPITNPNSVDLTPFAVPGTSSPIYTIYCKWTVEVDFDGGLPQLIEKSRPVYYFQCNSRPMIEESPLFPIVLDTVLNTDPIYDITPHIDNISPGVTSSWVLYPGEQVSGSDLFFNPATFSTLTNPANLIVQKVSSAGCTGNTVVKPFTFLINPGTPNTPEIITKRFQPASYSGSNSLVAAIAPFDNLLIALQESYANAEGIIGVPSVYGVPAYVPPPGCFLCPSPYTNYISYSLYQLDSLGLLNRNSTHLCTDKAYALPVYNPNASYTYYWETNRQGDWAFHSNGTTFNVMEPDSGIDRSYSVRVRAKNFLNVYSQPITFNLKFHTKYKLPAAVKDSACVDSSFTDNIPFSNSFYLHRDSIAWSDSHFADSLNSYAKASRIFGNTHSMLVFNGADTVGYNLNDSLFIGQIGEGLHSLPIQITSYYPYRQRNEPDNISPFVNGLFDLANNSNEDNLHPLGIPAYDYGCVCLSYDTLTVIGKPEVNVTYTLPDTVEQGYSTVFTSTANNPSLSYVWQFSDEGLSYNSDPLHYFYDIGPQSLALTVTDQYGCSSILGLNDITYVNLSYIGIEELENDFLIYPNPASDYIFINSASGTDFSVKLYNGLGQLLFSGINANTVDLTAYAPGMYQLQIFAGGVEKTYKIIKSNSN